MAEAAIQNGVELRNTGTVDLLVSLNTKPDRNLYRNTALIIYPDKNNYVVSNTENTKPIAIISYRDPTSVTVQRAWGDVLPEDKMCRANRPRARPSLLLDMPAMLNVHSVRKFDKHLRLFFLAAGDGKSRRKWPRLDTQLKACRATTFRVYSQSCGPVSDVVTTKVVEGAAVNVEGVEVEMGELVWDWWLGAGNSKKWRRCFRAIWGGWARERAGAAGGVTARARVGRDVIASGWSRKPGQRSHVFIIVLTRIKQATNGAGKLGMVALAEGGGDCDGITYTAAFGAAWRVARRVGSDCCTAVQKFQTKNIRQSDEPGLIIFNSSGIMKSAIDLM
ncbi:hypothetical protein F5887DRAFT_931236 [Amanita rubescens]|nr:hypothetical protein F5887DRAFT_931236 [Amanita rubescens]